MEKGGCFMRSVLQRIFFGVVLLAVALIIFANGVFGLNIPISFEGWWTLFLIIPGIAGIIAEGVRFWNFVITIVGLSLLAQAQGWLPERLSGAVFWAGILIIVGLWLIIGAFRPRRSSDGYHRHHHHRIQYHNNAYEDVNEYPDYIAVFSSHDTKNTSKSFRGGKITAVFGGASIDLREMQLAEDATLEVSAVFGGVEVILPTDLPIKMSSTPVFGGIDNSASNPSKVEGKYTLFIKGAAVFGGIEISN